MANISDALADIAVSRSLLLQRVANGLSRDVAKAYKEMLDDVLLSIKTADDITVKNLKKTISNLKNSIALDTKPIEKELINLSEIESNFIKTSVNEATGVSMFSQFPSEKVISNIYNTSLIEGAFINDWFSSLDKSMQTDLERAIRIGVSSGETNHEIAKRVDATLNTGIRHAKAIARTSVATVSNQARQSVYDANDDVIKGYEHLSTLDSKTSFICASRDGAMWDKDGKGLNKQGRDNRYRVPPLHFSCRSVLIPVLKSWKELGIDMEEISKGTRSSIDGYVSSGTNFEKWIKGKSPTFQEKYLGKGRYKLWKDKKITFSDLVNQQGIELNINELKEKHS